MKYLRAQLLKMTEAILYFRLTKWFQLKKQKSFMSLDRTDHLLSQARDAEDVVAVIAAWSSHYLMLDQTDKNTIKAGEVCVEEVGYQFY